MTLRLIVAGSRDLRYQHIPIVRDAIRRWIARNGRPTHVVCGGNCGRKDGSTLGVDLIGAHLALQAGVKIDLVPADWTRGGTVESDPKAGPDRNLIMIDQADGLVVVRHEWSRGSRNVLRLACEKFGAGSPRIEDVMVEKPAKGMVAR